MRIRCPHCKFGIDLISAGDDVDLDDLSCPSCGTAFSLLKDLEETQPIFTEIEKLKQFRFLQIVGRGQFGRVWKAQDEQLNRIVAIKVPHGSGLLKEEAEFFFREARTAAQLNHPNIVTLYEVGREGDVVYMISQFIEGCTLRDVIKDFAGKPREAASLCAVLAAALHFAHIKGIVHRDLKPSNVLMDHEGTPYITDFGLAKRDATEATIAVEGAILGTPNYMSPEQARGQAGKADRRSDVWALGVILYELLTSEKPFRGDSERGLIHQILNVEPTPPRRHNRQIPRDLETICLKALEKDPNRRYATAGQMADDLNRFLKNEPILARRMPLVERGWRWMQRRPATAAAALLSLAVVILLPLAVLPRYQLATRRVVLDTVPAGARVVFIPLDDRSYLPDYERRVVAGKSPISKRLPAGNYLVVAYKSDDLFHEVYRHVPAKHEEVTGFYDQEKWTREGSAVRLPTIRLHSTAKLNRSMRYVRGGTYRIVLPGIAGPQTVHLPNFWVDPWETTVSDLQAAKVSLPPALQLRPPPGGTPVHSVDWNWAVASAEKLGKRLLHEAEYEYLATAGGTRNYPATKPDASSWTLPPAEMLEADRMAAEIVEGPVYGLCSNVLEWTSTPWAERGIGEMHRVVRGGPALTDDEIAKGAAAYTPQQRLIFLRTETHPRLGFRCARSARPPVTAEDAIGVPAEN